jgi:hypothetical protein
MAKPLREDSITGADLTAFAANDSDFAFEMRVLLQLRDLGFQCEHSGTYEDPVSGKLRQFDLRANKIVGGVRLALAAECKNFRPYNPLLLSAVPRTEAESFHECVEVTPPSSYGRHSKCSRLSGCESVYPVREGVGKKTDQVGRERSTGELVRDDRETFEKLDQAVNSSRVLVRYYGSPFLAGPPDRRVIMPVLVVPDDVLWQVDYTADGTMAVNPRVVLATTLFLGRSWEFDRGDGLQVPYTMSHLEIWTPAGLASRIERLFQLFTL